MGKIIYLSFFIIFILQNCSASSFKFDAQNMGYKERMLLNGPYGEDIKTVISKKGSVFILEADSLGFERETILLMKIGLIKKLTAKNIKVEFEKNKERVILFRADKAVYSNDMKKIFIRNPTIQFPVNIKKPDKIIIELNRKIYLIYKKEIITYDF